MGAKCFPELCFAMVEDTHVVLVTLCSDNTANPEPSNTATAINTQ